ncbi:Wzz/FepE/Etk N-terminal domain-containing protein [Pseudomonas entomophila]|uniref:Wzz/FepE/Etk N-terminal domain-containing protein n=1 Tax=Pseudomonas entomophila TaxID=312306 RepID=UPI0020107032|nr:Wzz/FepE/Etk N-terminal domain-containing protein [Pseudomonas entomophila]
MSGITSIPPTATHPEIDLFSLLQALWRKKLQIAAVSAVCGVAAAAYSLSVTPQYEVGTVLLPAALKDLDALNRSQVYSLPPSEALRRVGASLGSYKTRLEYFRGNEQLQKAFVTNGRSEEQGFEEFNRRALKLEQADPKKVEAQAAFIDLEMSYPKGIDGQDVLNGLVQFTLERERQQISQEFRVIVDNRLSEVDAKIAVARVDYDAEKESRLAELREADSLRRAQLNDELRALRVQLKVMREDRIAQLSEAIEIARTLGLSRPTSPSSLAQQGDEKGGNVIRTEINNQQIPLYFMGTEALEAERQTLRKRSSDDFTEPRIAQIRKDLLLLEQNRTVQQLQQRQNDEVFVKGVEKLRAERIRLSNISTDLSELRLVNIDRPAVAPSAPIYPRKSLFVVLGLVVGGFVASLLVLMRHAFKSLRREQLRAINLPLSRVVETEVPAALPSRSQ